MEKSGVDKGLVVIGGSAGSLDVLLYLLPRLKPDFNKPIVVVLHRRQNYEPMLAKLLNATSTIPAKEADEKEEINPRKLYIAPADYHLLIENDHTFSLDFSEKINHSRPSIDVTFQCAADAYGEGLVCIILSGANGDGTEGFVYAKSKGATLIAQSPESAQVPYMPRHAIQNSPVDMVLSTEQMVGYLNSL